MFESQLRSKLAAGDVDDIAAFHALLLPLSCGSQLSIVSNQAQLIVVAAGRTPSDKLASNRLQTRPSYRLRVAFFRGSANSNLERLAALLSLDRGRFSVDLYTTSPAEGELAPLRSRSLLGVRDVDAARILSSYDILLDGSGHTAGNRLDALARRPSPIAASVLGFPSSYGGAGLVDYLTADRIVSPPNLCSACVARQERLALMPTTYQVVGRAVASLASGNTRGGAQPASKGSLTTVPTLILGTFTRSVRWHPDSFGLWASILLRTRPASAWDATSGRATSFARRSRRRTATTRVVGTSLWALADRKEERVRLAAELGAAGVSVPSRLRFDSFEPDKAAHLARHQELAMCVDTTPLYGSHTTAADAFGAARPLLTLPAETWASRVGASVANAAGVPQVVVASRKSLVDVAALLLQMAPFTPIATRQQAAALHPDQAQVANERWWKRSVGLDPSSSRLPFSL